MTKPTTERERQAVHFRLLQWWTFFSTDVYFGASLAAVFFLIYMLTPEQYEKVRDVINVVLGVVLREWAGIRGYVFGTSAGSARNAEALRSVVAKDEQKNPEA